MYKVIAVRANDDFSLDLKFDDGSVKRFDVTPYLNRGIFTELRDLNYFKQVTLAFDTVQWAKGQDISPETLYLDGHVIDGSANAFTTEGVLSTA